jgi:hypothetical protein
MCRPPALIDAHHPKQPQAAPTGQLKGHNLLIYKCCLLQFRGITVAVNKPLNRWLSTVNSACRGRLPPQRRPAVRTHDKQSAVHARR